MKVSFTEMKVLYFKESTTFQRKYCILKKKRNIYLSFYYLSFIILFYHLLIIIYIKQKDLFI